MQSNDGQWTSSVFRIISENMSVEDICNIINIKPSRCFVKGAHYSKRNANSKIRDENLVIFENGLDEQTSIESHILYFLSLLKDRKNQIRRLQSECKFGIACAFSSGNGQGGFTLDHEILKKLTEYPIELSINLYPPEERFHLEI